ncbi:Kelch repeat-containing protein [Micromonospora sp. URMC 105]|uniref:Kelch repeat-containing protein n=1 Tax=Micromonospora sp. URMC 105 TaxID=3423413 RepID=UPI003F1B69C3
MTAIRIFRRGTPRRILCIGIVLALAQALAPTASAAGTGVRPRINWRGEDPLSSARYALAAAAVPDGSIFAIGGADGASVTRVVEVYSVRTRQWTFGPPLPRSRYRHAAATGGDGRVYAIGGSSPGDEQAFLASVLALRPGTNHWVPVAPMPTPRQLLAATTGRDGRIYAVGGHHYRTLSALEIYDPKTNRWTTGAPMPTPRYEMGVASGPDGRIFAIGGCGNGVLNVLDVVEVYSPRTNTWTTAAPLPTRRCLVDATSGPDGRIYAVGGCELVTTPTGTSDCVDTARVDVYSPRTNSWKTVTGTAIPHREGALVTSGRRMFAIGGHTDAVESARLVPCWIRCR